MDSVDQLRRNGRLTRAAALSTTLYFILNSASAAPNDAVKEFHSLVTKLEKETCIHADAIIKTECESAFLGLDTDLFGVSQMILEAEIDDSLEDRPTEKEKILAEAKKKFDAARVRLKEILDKYQK